MAYIWENYSPDKDYEVAYRSISPYTEVWDSSGSRVLVNIFHRLLPVFVPQSALQNPDDVPNLLDAYETDPRFRTVAGLLLHAAARLDRVRGMRLEEAVDGIYEEEVRRGAYGAWAADTFERLTSREQRDLLRCMTIYHLGEERSSVFGTALMALFHAPELYYEHSTGITHVYIDEKRSVSAEEKYRLVDFLFRDMSTPVTISWKGEHFGVIGVDRTMKADQTALT